MPVDELEAQRQLILARSAAAKQAARELRDESVRLRRVAKGATPADDPDGPGPRQSVHVAVTRRTSLAPPAPSMVTLPRMDDMSVPLISVSTAVDGARGVVTVGGEVDVACADRVASAVASVVEAGATEAVTLDISAVTFVDSYGIRVLVSARDQVAELVIVGATPRIRRMFEIVGLADVLT